MLIFADNHRKYLTKAELQNLEKDEQADIDELDYSLLQSPTGLVDNVDPMWAELAPEHQIPGHTVYLQPQALVPSGGTETNWDSAEWYLDTYDAVTQKQTRAGPLGLNKHVTKMVSRGSNKARLRAHGYVFHAKRATFVNLDIEMNSQSDPQYCGVRVIRTVILKNSQSVPRNAASEVACVAGVVGERDDGGGEEGDWFRDLCREVGTLGTETVFITRRGGAFSLKTFEKRKHRSVHTRTRSHPTPPPTHSSH